MPSPGAKRGKEYDISSAGRGAQQTLLLLAYVRTNPNSILLLDEPDAHLEILRQRQTYNVLVRLASEQGSQIWDIRTPQLTPVGSPACYS